MPRLPRSISLTPSRGGEPASHAFLVGRLIRAKNLIRLQTASEASQASSCQAALDLMAGRKQACGTWVWLKIIQQGLRRFWSMCPLTSVPVWYWFFEPQPNQDPVASCASAQSHPCVASFPSLYPEVKDRPLTKMLSCCRQTPAKKHMKR